MRSLRQDGDQSSDDDDENKSFAYLPIVNSASSRKKDSQNYGQSGRFRGIFDDYFSSILVLHIYVMFNPQFL